MADLPQKSVSNQWMGPNLFCANHIGSRGLNHNFWDFSSQASLLVWVVVRSLSKTKPYLWCHPFFRCFQVVFWLGNAMLFPAQKNIYTNKSLVWRYVRSGDHHDAESVLAPRLGSPSQNQLSAFQLDISGNLTLRYFSHGPFFSLTYLLKIMIFSVANS